MIGPDCPSWENKRQSPKKGTISNPLKVCCAISPIKRVKTYRSTITSTSSCVFKTHSHGKSEEVQPKL